MVTIRTLTSESAPSDTWPAVAGAIPFSLFRMNLASNEYGWFPLPVQLSSPSLPPGGEWMVRLEARRRDMMPFTGSASQNGAIYQNILEVQDNTGFRQLVGVTAEGLARYGSSGGGSLRAASVNNTPDPYAGLWVGHAVVRKVSQPSNITQPDIPLPVATPLQYRILIHVDAQGRARLLQ